MYNLIEYSDTYSKISGGLWQYYRVEPTLDHNNNIIDFPVDSNNSALFKFKEKITGPTGNNGTKDVETMVLLKYVNNFWRILWSSLVAGTAANQEPTFTTTDTKLYVPVVTLSTQDNA